MSDNCNDQRGAIKAYAKAGKTMTEAFHLLKEAFGHNAMSRMRVFDFFKQYKDGRESIKNQKVITCEGFWRGGHFGMRLLSTE